MKMLKESKRGTEEKERKQMKMKNSALLVELLLHWNTHDLMFSLSLCYFGTNILAISCFHCLQNDDVIEFALFCQVFFLNFLP